MAGYIGKSQGVTLLNVESNTVETADIQDGAVTSAKLGADVVLDVVGDTTPQLGGDLDGNGNTIDLTGNTESFGLPVGTTAQAPSAATTKGHIRFDDDDDIVYYSNGVSWKKISSVIVQFTSLTGSIFAGSSSSLTLAGTGFGNSITVNFTQSSDAIDEDVSVTPTSDTSATVTVPSAVYNNVTGGNVVTVTITNFDGNTASQTTTAVALPTGGTITTSGNYRYHTFTSSGTFTNTISNLSVDYMTVAGGAGGGGRYMGGGGGAGGVVAATGTSLSSGAYTVTVGSGGSGGAENTQGTNGGSSVISSVSTTAVGGGGGGSWDQGQETGKNGGSGGGNSGYLTSGGGSGTSGQGNNGGYGGLYGGGGGGGAGAAGSNGTGADGGNGGVGTNSYSAWATATSTGDSGYYAGGGGGGDYSGTGANPGGAGGGGNGAPGPDNSSGGAPTSATANTGGGGGGANGYNNTDTSGGNGGSGIVIVRYQL